MRIINRKVHHNYHILQTLEAGIVLSGAEVKSVRLGKVRLDDSFAKIQNGQIFLKNVYIFPYQPQSDGYDPRHDRKLLLHRNQINQLAGKVSSSATTLVPLKMYTKHNLIKVELALAASKKKFDKRKAKKEKDEQRRLAQEMKGSF